MNNASTKNASTKNVVLPHRRSIDGLRALAVTAVLLYHAEISWLPGGFLGVDVFFVISGYLIASLLVAEHDATGGISLPGFWARRARRLLPAVGLLLLGVTIAALVDAHDGIGRLRGDVLAALSYSSNWWQVVRGETYFESFGRPPLLRHLWSLAVEEQLYIVLPVALALLGRRGWMRAHRRRLVALGAFAGALASLVLLNALWREADPSRAWFGTDTRASGLLVGVGLALLCPLGARRRWSGGARTLTDVAAVGSLAGLAVLMATMGDRAAALHHFGFGLTVVLAGLAVVALTGPSCRVSRFLGLRPLVWIGTRSYAIYLWHWPVFVLTRPRVDVAIDGWRLLAVRLLLTAVLAEVSWRLVEQPFRAGTVARHWRELRHGLRWRIALGAVSTVAVLASALGVGLSSAAVSPTPELLATVAVSPSSPTTLARIPPTTATTTTTALPTTTVPSAPAPVPTTAPPPPLPAGAVLAIGDSVMLAARDALISGSGGHMYVDAAIGRQPSQGLDVLQHYKDDGAFAQLSAIVVHLGTNGAMSDKLFDRLAAIVAGVPRVVVLNVRVPKSWEGQSNAAIDGGAPQRANMRLGDWHTASDQPGALGPDGVHPTRSGARIYRDVVLRELAGAPPPPTTTTTTTTAPPPPTTTTGPPATTTTTTPVGTATTLVP